MDLGETVVVFTAAIAVLSMLGLRRRNRKDELAEEEHAKELKSKGQQGDEK